VKKVTALLVFIALSVSGVTQSVHYMIPFGVFANAYADTMLVTKAVLLKAGISSYSFDASEWKDGFNSKTVYVNKVGNITAAKYCSVIKDSGVKFCTYDTILYDEKDRMVEQRMYNGRMKLDQVVKAVYISEMETKYTTIYNNYYDTSVSIVRLDGDRKIKEVAHKSKDSDTAYSRFYYNSNGLLDSVKDAFAPRTFVFKHRERKGEKILEMEAIYKITFVFNDEGQYIENFSTERYHTYDNAPLNQVTKYYYNADNTLSKIVRREKYTPNVIKPQVKTIYYSYTKY